MANPASLVPFVKGDPRCNRKGRPPKTVGLILGELEKEGYMPVTKSQVVDMYLTLLNVEQEQLTKIVNDHNNPMLNRIVAKRLLAKDGFEIIEKMLDRAIGKAEQKTDITSDGKVLPAIINIIPPETLSPTSEPQE